jgi:GntR family transcriptional regulator
MKIPIYQVIENHIKEKISNNEFKHGDMIHSENDLKEMFNVSRMTVRQAINNLVNEGLLYTHKGKGTFVNNLKIEKKIQGLLGFSEEMKLMNRKVSNRLISFNIIKASKEIGEKLFIDEGDEVYLIERIRYGDKIPVLFEKLYLPRKIFKTIDATIMNSSFYNFVEEELNYRISHCIQTVEAKSSDKAISEYLEIPKLSAVLYLTRNTFLDRGFPFEYVQSYYRADQYRFIQQADRK